MDELKNKEFLESLEINIESYGEKNQEGVKASLRDCQEIFGFISSDKQMIIADTFGVDPKIIKILIKLTPSLKELLVDYEVVVCSGSRCANKGSIEVIKEIKKGLGIDFNQVTKDGKIRLTSKNCFKMCGVGPNVMVNDKIYNHMDKHKAKELIDRLVNK